MFAPTTKVRFLSNVQCDPTNENFLNFTTEALQQAYFVSKTISSYDTCAVVDVEGMQGFIKWAGDAGIFYNCNYLMWQNSQIGTKWFYAYVDNVRPIGNGVCMAHYTVDVFQTWYFEMLGGIQQCFISRMTVLDDTRGKWQLPENIETGEYVTVDETDLLVANTVDTTNYLVVVYTTQPTTANEDSNYFIEWDETSSSYKLPDYAAIFAGGKVAGGIYQGSFFKSFKCANASDVETINAYLQTLIGKGQISSIVDCFMCPKYLADLSDNNTFTQSSKEITLQSTPTKFGDYTPENKKCFNQEWNYSVIQTPSGSLEMGYEYFTGTTAARLQSVLTTNSAMRLVLENYKGLDLNYLYQVQMTGYPKASFSFNSGISSIMENQSVYTYEHGGAVGSYVSGNFFSATGDPDHSNKGIVDALNMTGAALSQATNLAKGSVLGLIGQGFSSAGSTADDVYKNAASRRDLQRMPNKLQGQASTNIDFSAGRMSFIQYRMQIQEDFAKMLDRYLKMYGYKVNVIEKPHFQGRAVFDYVRCVNPVISANIPYEANNAICSILKSGVRVWHSSSYWLNYSVANSIN